MYSIEEWDEVFQEGSRYLREFMEEHTIEEIGIPDNFDWELFYEHLTDDEPFKAGRGVWPEIFKNWYRKDRPETLGIASIASGCTNADEDIYFFTNTAIYDDLWRREDYFSVINKKIENAYKSTKLTPSRRFLNQAWQNKYSWLKDYFGQIDILTLYRLTAPTLTNILERELIAKSTKRILFDIKDIDKNTLIKLLDFNTVSTLIKDSDTTNNLVILNIMRCVLDKDTTHYNWNTEDLDLFHTKYKELEPNQKKEIKKLLNKALKHKVEMSYYAVTSLAATVYSDSELLKLNAKTKIKLSEYSILTKYSIDTNSYSEEAARILKLYCLNTAVFDITDDLSSTNIKNVVNAHFSEILSVTDDFEFSSAI